VSLGFVLTRLYDALSSSLSAIGSSFLYLSPLANGDSCLKPMQQLSKRPYVQ